MEDAKKEKDAEKLNFDTSAFNPDPNKEKEAKAAGRARTRSLWGRKKEKPIPVA